jgi:TrmH family RNA methyltransferase
MKNWKDNVHFILVEPVESGNIGASARAIKNMGFKNLALVNPPAKMTEEADFFAHNAMDVLKSSKRHQTLTDALADKSLVIGTSRRKGKRRGLFIPIDEAADKVFTTARQKGKVAVLFGREQRGLFNTETDECAFMISIPTDSRQPSINLAQAVMLVAYELGKYRADTDATLSKGREPLSTHAEQTMLYERLKHILELLGYTKMGDRNIGRKVLVTIKHFLGRAGFTQDELDLLYGICTRLAKRLEK